jgi:hypothetical protein
LNRRHFYLFDAIMDGHREAPVRFPCASRERSA